jgi:hypothetical protein
VLTLVGDRLAAEKKNARQRRENSVSSVVFLWRLAISETFSFEKTP